MAQRLHCPKCGAEFTHDDGHLGKGVGGAAGAAAGAALGAKIGIALGPLGAIAGTIPGAVLGALGAGTIGKMFADDPQCPRCSTRFSV